MPQTKRIVITLDPDYIPWEHKEDVVRLRKKKIKVPKFFIAILVIIGMLIFAVISKLESDKQQTVATATPTPAPVVNPYADWCEFNGLLLAPGVYTIGAQEHECKNGELQLYTP